MATGPTHHEFFFGGVAASSLLLGDEETVREEKHLPLLGSCLATRLDVECVLEGDRETYCNYCI